MEPWTGEVEAEDVETPAMDAVDVVDVVDAARHGFEWAASSCPPLGGVAAVVEPLPPSTDEAMFPFGRFDGAAQSRAEMISLPCV